MALNLILIALAPVVILLFYVYYRDKYDKEPIWLLILSFLSGAFIVIPVIFVERALSFPGSWMLGYLDAGWDAFVVAAFSEELFKFIAVIILIWWNKNFNERFDGIVYAVYVSMGFAMVENLLYVVNGGIDTALLRAITAVPAHAIFGITMGYYLGRAKFNKKKRGILLFAALAMPILVHGLYDFILMSEMPMFFLFFIVYMYVLYRLGFKRMKQLSDMSRFKPSKFNPFKRRTEKTTEEKAKSNEDTDQKGRGFNV